MSDNNYVPDALYDRIFRPWRLDKRDWHLAEQDWVRVLTVCNSVNWWGRILDVGAGDGTLAAMLCSRHPAIHQIHCVEPDHLQVCRMIERFPGWPLSPHCGYLSRQTVQGPFDGALCCEVLEHVSEETGHAIVSEIVYLCAPGARILVTVPARGGPREKYPGHVRSFDAEGAARLLDGHGLKQIQVTGILPLKAFGDCPVWHLVTAYV